MQRFVFPAWINQLIPLAGAFLLIGAGFYASLGAAAIDPVLTNKGYKPEQPIPFSHAIHAGKLKMDCRYCHNTVDKAAHAAIPPISTCLNCHSPKDEAGNVVTTAVHTESPKLALLREAAQTGDYIPWERVHDLPDYAYFNHSVHVNRGVSCVSCHGRIDQMDVVEQKATLTMGFCLSCHRNPEPSLRPVEEVTNLGWEADGDPALLGAALALEKGIHPRDNCSVCHR